MKFFVTAIFLMAHAHLFSQQKLVNEAVVHTTINVIAPDEEESAPGRGPMGLSNALDGETKMTTWVKNDQVKTVLKSEVGRSTILRNNSTKVTTVLLEIMGTKQGFAISDSEQTDLKRKTDSMMQARQGDSTTQPRQEPKIELVETSELKKISGYQCRKAFLITSRLPGITDTVTVWYNPDMKLSSGPTLDAGSNPFARMLAVNGLEKVNGMVMRYETRMRRNRRLEAEVTKIETGKEIPLKEFEVPKDFEVKPMKEMQNMFGGRAPR